MSELMLTIFVPVYFSLSENLLNYILSHFNHLPNTYTLCTLENKYPIFVLPFIHKTVICYLHKCEVEGDARPQTGFAFQKFLPSASRQLHIT